MPTVLEPHNIDELSEALRAAHSEGERVCSFNLCRLNRILDHAPEDMTVTAEAGLTLASLQGTLAARGQWLPIDPPQPERKTIGAILATNASGPRRLGYGAVRDWLIELKVVLANGSLIKSGGRVVKNVAGYDLTKLFIGSQGTLGVIVEATFKLRPLPEREALVQHTFARLDEAIGFVETISESTLSPVILDLHNIPIGHSPSAREFSVVLGLAGAREDVEDELRRAAELGATEVPELTYEKLFWNEPTSDPVRKWSVLPSALGQSLRQLNGAAFVARAGNGIIFYRAPSPPPASPRLSGNLFQRVKDAFDPKHIFPELTA